MKENKIPDFLKQGFDYKGQHFTETSDGIFKDVFTAKKGRKPTLTEKAEVEGDFGSPRLPSDGYKKPYS